MKALVKMSDKPRDVKYMEVDAPSPQEGYLLLKIKASGLCGTDMEVYHSQFKTSKVPIIMGHEGSGEVIELGKNVQGFALGDRVCFETPWVICEKCKFCRTGKYNLCLARKGLGYNTDGTFAEFLTVNASRAHTLPDSISFEEAALLEPLSVGMRAVVEISNLKTGDDVVILGSGPIGLMIAHVAAISGAKNTIVVGRRNRMRLDLAKKIGADHAIRLEDGIDPIAAVQELTAGGADIVFEATGHPPTAITALELVKKGGEVIMAGLYPSPVEVLWNRVVQKEIIVKGSWTSGVFTDWERSLAYVSKGTIDIKPYITHKIPLPQWEEAIELMDTGQCIKVVLTQ